MQKNIQSWLNNKRIIRIFLYIYFCILTWLLLRPSGKSDTFYRFIYPIYNDKVIHTGTFFILFLLGRFSYPKKRSFLFMVIFTLYGVLIEFLQEYMNMGRIFEYSDILADFIGCFLGMITARLIITKKNIQF